MPKKIDLELSEALIEKRLIDKKIIDEIIQEANASGSSLPQLLIKRGLFSEGR